ncbi:MAG: DNA mismatch repair endonuclease MutL [Clostridia bacterium]
MADRIIILDENTSNQIAAGEVIERPSSVLKELIENAIDAGSTRIEVEISKGGITSIRVTDNGSGICSEDVMMAFERHGTSKIKRAEDLTSISTMGFRGEALASIASVSRTIMTTRTPEEETGTRIQVQGGEYAGASEHARTPGTTVLVNDLFYNTPARYKFLKNDATEGRYCTEVVSRLALSRPDISFSFLSNRQEILRTPGDGDLLSAVYAVYGRETARDLVPVDYMDMGIGVSGFAGKASLARGNRQHQMIYLNKRGIRSRDVTRACEKAYETLLAKGKFPFFILSITMESSHVDVNVHPAKTEVRFQDDNAVFKAVYHGVGNALAGGRTIEKAKPGPPEPPPPAQTVMLHEVLVNGATLVKEAFREYQAPLAIRETHQAEQVPKPAERIGLFTVVGQLFGTYIVLQRENDVLFMDQHAAHERITYEKLLRDYGNRWMHRQMLLVPVEVNLSPQEIALMEENMELVGSLGFDADLFGTGSVLVRSVPRQIGEDNAAEAFRAMVDGLLSNRKNEMDQKAREAIYMMACKHSVKANRKLHAMEMEALAKELDGLENPFTCPHGRPVILKMEKHDFEKMFKRVK